MSDYFVVKLRWIELFRLFFFLAFLQYKIKKKQQQQRNKTWCLLGKSCSSVFGIVSSIPHLMKFTRADKVIKRPLRWQPGSNGVEAERGSRCLKKNKITKKNPPSFATWGKCKERIQRPGGDLLCGSRPKLTFV